MLLNYQKYLSNEPAFRLKQIKGAIFQKLISDWAEATVLTKTMREQLNIVCPLTIKAEIFVSKDKSAKAAIELQDGLKIETVLMRSSDGRNTVCVSTQVGCPMGCVFCATGSMGFKRNLTSDEMLEQVLFFARLLKKENEKVTNVVYMGMGEPFLNYQNVINSIEILHDPEGFNLGARNFSISTVGVVEGIEKLAEERLDVNLAISLHSADNDLRRKLIPCAEKYPLNEILKAVDDYLKKKNRQVMFEYILLDKINDSDRDAQNLARIMKKKLYHVNLIPYNETGRFKASPVARVKKFKAILEDAGVSVTQRFRFGDDIKAACGQLIV